LRAGAGRKFPAGGVTSVTDTAGGSPPSTTVGSPIFTSALKRSPAVTTTGRAVSRPTYGPARASIEGRISAKSWPRDGALILVVHSRTFWLRTAAA